MENNLNLELEFEIFFREITYNFGKNGNPFENINNIMSNNKLMGGHIEIWGKITSQVYLYICLAFPTLIKNHAILQHEYYSNFVQT